MQSLKNYSKLRMGYFEVYGKTTKSNFLDALYVFDLFVIFVIFFAIGCVLYVFGPFVNWSTKYIAKPFWFKRLL